MSERNRLTSHSSPELKASSPPSKEDVPERQASENKHSAPLFNPIQLLKDSASLLGQPEKLLAGLAPAQSLISGKVETQQKHAPASTSKTGNPVPENGHRASQKEADSAPEGKLPHDNLQLPAKSHGLLADASTRAMADRFLHKLSDSPNPVSDISSSLKNLDNLQGASIVRRPDGKHQVEVQLAQASYLPAVNIQMRGFHPGPTLVSDHVGFVVSQQNQGTLVEDMHGFSGSVTRRRTLSTETTSMFLTSDTQGQPCIVAESNVHLRRRVMHNAATLHENNFQSDSPMRNFLQQRDALKNVGSALTMFQNTDDIGTLSIKKTSPDNFQVAAEGDRAKHVEINEQLKGLGLTVKSLDLDKSLSAGFSYDDKGVNLQGIKGMKLTVSTALGDVTVAPVKVALQGDRSGKATVNFAFQNPEDKSNIVSFAVPMTKLLEQAQMRLRQ